VRLFMNYYCDLDKSVERRVAAIELHLHHLLKARSAAPRTIFPQRHHVLPCVALLQLLLLLLLILRLLGCCCCCCSSSSSSSSHSS